MEEDFYTAKGTSEITARSRLTSAIFAMRISDCNAPTFLVVYLL